MKEQILGLTPDMLRYQNRSIEFSVIANEVQKLEKRIIHANNNKYSGVHKIYEDYELAKLPSQTIDYIIYHFKQNGFSAKIKTNGTRIDVFIGWSRI